MDFALIDLNSFLPGEVEKTKECETVAITDTNDKFH